MPRTRNRQLENWEALEQKRLSEGELRREIYEHIANQFDVSLTQVYNLLGSKYLHRRQHKDFAESYAAQFGNLYKVAQKLESLSAEEWMHLNPNDYGWDTLGELLFFAASVHPENWPYDRVPDGLEPSLTVLWLEDHPDDRFYARVKQVVSSLRKVGQVL